jgi:anti-sigma regulatory factor (Ser/Thr protein kinase)
MNRLTVPGELDSLAAIYAFVEQAADTAALCQQDSYRLRLAVDEIATNAIEHGYAGREGDLRLTARLDEQSLTVCVEDGGPPFDPWRQSPPVDLERPLLERPLGGLGVYLARYGADSVAYERINDRNCTSLTLKRRPAAKGDSAL